MAAEPLFTEQLRASSKSQHAIADALVVAKLLVAFTDRALYGAALGRFYHVYQAIESSLGNQTQQPGERCSHVDLCTQCMHVEISACCAALEPIRRLMPKIERHTQFEHDLEYFLG